jgi:probable HAF family extracellular repeat protein
MNAVLWKNGHIINLGTLGGYESLSSEVNARGQVVGHTTNNVPDSYFGVGTQVCAFLWDEKNGMQDLGTLGGPDAAAADTNEHGQIVGQSFTSFTPNPNTMMPTLDPFLLENGKMVDLGTLGGTIGGAGGINHRGQVFGNSNLVGDTPFHFHGFLWDHDTLKDIGTSG